LKTVLHHGDDPVNSFTK